VRGGVQYALAAPERLPFLAWGLQVTRRPGAAPPAGLCQAVPRQAGLGWAGLPGWAAAHACQLGPAGAGAPPTRAPRAPLQAFTSKLAPEDAQAVVKDVRAQVESSAWSGGGRPREGEEGWEPLGIYMTGLEVCGGGGGGGRGGGRGGCLLRPSWLGLPSHGCLPWASGAACGTVCGVGWGAVGTGVGAGKQ
jgi:hypothetical protein